MKRFFIAFALLVVAGLATVLWLASSLEGLVEDAIEEVGSELLGTRVSVAGVSIDLRAGRGTIRRLRIRNPEGFSSAHAVSVAEVVLAIDLQSLTGGPIVLNEVRVGAPDVLAEANERGLNLEVLRRHVEATDSGRADAEVAPADGEPRRIAIRRFEVEDGMARSDTTALGGTQEEIPVPGLVMQDVGGSRGATPGALGKQILRAWLSRMANAAARYQARRAVGEALDDAIEEGSEKLRDAVRGIFD